MSKAKPFLFGAALGASAMFFALQYHVVQSHDGFQVVPRTPQQSLGLAYADIRSWSASQWTDRPELARALMAHGSSDLIAESVASTLTDKVSEDTSTLDELRAFLNGPEAVRTPRQDGSDTSESGKSGSGADNDVFRIPFPQDPGTSALADPFRVARAEEEKIQPSPVSNSRFSAEDVLEGLKDSTSDVPLQAPAQTPAISPTAAKSPSQNKSPAKQAQEMEDRIFGNAPAPLKTTAPPSTPGVHPKPVESESMFEEVTTQLENRAQEALNRARETLTEKAAAATENTAKSSVGYVREKAAELVPNAAKSLPDSAGAEAAKTATTPLGNFDPFLE